jgi:hypothetical protein
LKKLLKLKKWLTVPDAARHLSIVLDEEVSEADVLRLALDGHLVLSVEFVNGATAQCGKIIPLRDAEIKEVQNLGGDGIVKLIKGGISLGDNKVLSYNKEITKLVGVWNLALVGPGRFDVADKYHLLTGGPPPVELVSSCGLLVYYTDGTWARIMEYCSEEKFSFAENKLYNPRENPDNYREAYHLPSDAVLVVRTSALQQLQTLISEPEPSIERPVARRERSTLLVVIAALAKLARIDVSKVSSAATRIETLTASMGARVAARTIENHLRRIPDAVDNKTED